MCEVPGMQYFYVSAFCRKYFFNLMIFIKVQYRIKFMIDYSKHVIVLRVKKIECLVLTAKRLILFIKKNRTRVLRRVKENTNKSNIIKNIINYYYCFEKNIPLDIKKCKYFFLVLKCFSYAIGRSIVFVISYNKKKIFPVFVNC